MDIFKPCGLRNTLFAVKFTVNFKIVKPTLRLIWNELSDQPDLVFYPYLL